MYDVAKSKMFDVAGLNSIQSVMQANLWEVYTWLSRAIAGDAFEANLQEYYNQKNKR